MMEEVDLDQEVVVVEVKVVVVARFATGVDLALDEEARGVIVDRRIEVQGQGSDEGERTRQGLFEGAPGDKRKGSI